MKYSIERICWCPSTFNGFEDSPYWKIVFSGYVIGLTDDGKYWGINVVAVPESVKEMLNRIITECKLQIVLED